MDNPIFANYPFTIYDEHTPTVLELLSKQHAQLVALGNEFNQLAKVEAIRKGYITVWPSGDKTGQADRLAIQTALDTCKVVELASGDFYIGRSLTMHAGNQLIGNGLSTCIHVTELSSAIEGAPAGFDHIVIKDLYIVNASDFGHDETFNAINLWGNDKEPYNGARYSLIDGVRISGFMAGVMMRGAWSSTIRRVRTIGCVYGFQGAGCVNNVTIENCEFTHGDFGVYLRCDNSTEMYGIRINNTNFEGNSVRGVDAQGVIGLTMTDCYSEATEQIFSVNSCPMFKVNGGRFSGVTLFGTVTSTAYTTDKFVNPKCHIENAVIEVTAERPDLLYIDGGVTNSVVRNNHIINEHQGNVAMLTNFNGVVHKEYRAPSMYKGIRYSGDFFQDVQFIIDNTERVMVTKVTMMPEDDYETGGSLNYTLFAIDANGDSTKLGQTNTVTEMTAGELLTVTLNKVMLPSSFSLQLVPSRDIGMVANFYINIDMKIGDPGNQY